MADKEIPDLTAASVLDGTEQLHVVQGGNSRKTSVDEISTYIGGDPENVVWAKKSCRAATTANHSLTGLADVDGVTITEGAYVLVMFQTAPAENGIYQASAGAWTRGPNADTSVDVGGAAVTVRYGTLYGGTLWRTNFKASQTLGTDAMNWYQVADLTSTQTVKNKTLDSTNSITVEDANFTLQDNGDATKQMKFQLSGNTAGQTRVLTPPDADTVLYGRSNIIGTVSQSSGTPTGAAFERDSNGNGRWWKAAEGHMRCSRDYFLVGPITTVDVAGYTSGTFTWTFPQTFAAIPNVKGAVSDGRSSVHIISATKTSVTFKVRSPEATNFLLANLEANGRWFATGVTNPADLFLSGEKGGWWDFTNPATLFTDTARTTLVTATGALLAGVSDLSGNGFHLQQATSTKRPVWSLDAFGRGAATFDGVDDCLTSIISFALASGQVTILAAVRKSVDASARLLELGPTTASNANTFGMLAPNTAAANFAFQSVGANGTVVTSTTPNSYAAPITAVVVGIGDTSAPKAGIRANKSSETVNTTTAQGGGNYSASQTLNVGARNNGGSISFNGWISELIIRAGVLSEADITSLTEYLYSKAGV